MTPDYATKPIRPDGLPYEITWQGNRYLVPPEEELLLWAFTNKCKSPKGEPVPCESEDSWLSLCGLLPKKEIAMDYREMKTLHFMVRVTAPKEMSIANMRDKIATAIYLDPRLRQHKPVIYRPRGALGAKIRRLEKC